MGGYTVHFCSTASNQGLFLFHIYAAFEQRMSQVK